MRAATDGKEPLAGSEDGGEGQQPVLIDQVRRHQRAAVG
jgi:hypothetical protein